jgi:hypothetical protein
VEGLPQDAVGHEASFGFNFQLMGWGGGQHTVNHGSTSNVQATFCREVTVGQPEFWVACGGGTYLAFDDDCDGECPVESPESEGVVDTGSSNLSMMMFRSFDASAFPSEVTVRVYAFSGAGGEFTLDIPTAAVPEPATGALVGIAALILAWKNRRR